MVPCDMQTAMFHICFYIHLTIIFVGMLAAEVTFGVLNKGLDMDTYWDALRNSWIWEELHKSRNYRPVSEAIHCHFFVLFLFLSFPLFLFKAICLIFFIFW